MKIAKYVGELLFDYECVVIPGLGGFIAEDKPVSINKVTDKFSPPFRKIHFNIHLRANDGLLVNYVAQQEQIGYKTAKQKVDKFVFLCHNALNEGKKINFKSIGSISYDKDRNILFYQDGRINYNSNSFGLGSLVSPSIRRVTDEEKVKKVVKSAIDKSKQRTKSSDRTDKKIEEPKKPVVRKMEANRRRSPFANQLIFLAVVMFFMSLGYVYMRRDAMSYYAKMYIPYIPFFYSSVNDYLATNINTKHVAKLSRSAASFFPIILEKDKQTENTNSPNLVQPNEVEIGSNSDIDRGTDIKKPYIDKKTGNIIVKPVVEDEIIIPVELSKEESIEIVNQPEKEEVIANNLVDKPKASSDNKDRFFIIAGSFSNENNAKRLVSDLKQQGYKALIADTNRYGMFRVAFMSFNNRGLANQELVAIRNDANPKAWLLVK